MSLFKMLKKNARLALRGQYGKAIGILLISFSVSLLLVILQGVGMSIVGEQPMVTTDNMDFNHWLEQEFTYSVGEQVVLAASGLLTFLVIAPLGLGSVRWYNQLVHSRENPVGELFHFFESGRGYFRSLWYHISLYLRMFFSAMLLYLVPMSILFASAFALDGRLEDISREVRALATSGIILSLFLLLLVSVLYSVYVNKYRLTPFLLQEGDDQTVGRAIKESVAFSKGYRFSFFLFDLSFIGWFMLCVLVWPLALYVIPYYNTSFAMYSRYVIEKNRYVPETPEATREFMADEDRWNTSPMQQENPVDPEQGLASQHTEQWNTQDTEPLPQGEEWNTRDTEPQLPPQQSGAAEEQDPEAFPTRPSWNLEDDDLSQQ